MWPDPAYPADIATFRKNGYHMRIHTKDVLGGIEAVRSKFNPMGRPPELFLLKGDPGCELLATRIIAYKWKLDSAGRPTDTPDDVNDDLCDALRYSIQNEFRMAGKVTVGKETGLVVASDQPKALTEKNWAAEKVKELTGGDAPVASTAKRVKKGNFFADFS
jgi:hypothetical protein